MVMDALSNWEIYLHSEEKDTLVQLAILKAQFELIHPFSDGNGRIGRMLVPLILYSKKLLGSPMFYISAYLEQNRDEYYERLLAISRTGDWNGWISFFLRAVVEQAEENGQKAQHILMLYDDMKQKVPEITRSKYAILTIDAIFSRPIFRLVDFIEDSEIPTRSAQRILEQLKNAGVLEVLRERIGRRPAVYVFPQLIAISEGGR
jgi:Fic family protein